MPESLACGTPVIALREGSVPEVLEDGVTGFICDFEDELVRLSRDCQSCRVERLSSGSRAALLASANGRRVRAGVREDAGRGRKPRAGCPGLGLGRKPLSRYGP